jgi:hypothetical protein
MPQIGHFSSIRLHRSQPSTTGLLLDASILAYTVKGRATTVNSVPDSPLFSKIKAWFTAGKVLEPAD